MVTYGTVLGIKQALLCVFPLLVDVGGCPTQSCPDLQLLVSGSTMRGAELRVMLERNGFGRLRVGATYATALKVDNLVEAIVLVRCGGKCGEGEEVKWKEESEESEETPHLTALSTWNRNKEFSIF